MSNVRRQAERLTRREQSFWMTGFNCNECSPVFGAVCGHYSSGFLGTISQNNQQVDNQLKMAVRWKGHATIIDQHCIQTGAKWSIIQNFVSVKLKPICYGQTKITMVKQKVWFYVFFLISLFSANFFFLVHYPWAQQSLQYHCISHQGEMKKMRICTKVNCLIDHSRLLSRFQQQPIQPHGRATERPDWFPPWRHRSFFMPMQDRALTSVALKAQPT